MKKLYLLVLSALLWCLTGVMANAAEVGQAAPQFALPGAASHPLPYLAYAPGAYLGRVVDQIIKTSPTPVHLDRQYETDMAEGLKAMSLEGHGIAFLPASAVRGELASRRLVLAGAGLEAQLEIRIYRDRTAHRPVKGTVDKFWHDLEQHLQRHPAGKSV